VEKLRIYGAEQATCQWIISYMLGRFQLVQVGEACSQERNLYTEFPRGVGYLLSSSYASLRICQRQFQLR
jgi:hypothetical protein